MASLEVVLSRAIGRAAATASGKVLVRLPLLLGALDTLFEEDVSKGTSKGMMGGEMAQAWIEGSADASAKILDEKYDEKLPLPEGPNGATCQ